MLAGGEGNGSNDRKQEQEAKQRCVAHEYEAGSIVACVAVRGGRAACSFFSLLPALHRPSGLSSVNVSEVRFRFRAVEVRMASNQSLSFNKHSIETVVRW
jgi:hypothetical protein